MALKPTDAELEILNLLWNSGPSTVRQLNDQQSKNRKIGYTTTLKIMQHCELIQNLIEMNPYI